jgi:hypothetical protein
MAMDTRNRCRRLLTAVALGLLATLMLTMPALAGRTWCSKDPIVRLNGEDVQIWVGIPEEFVPSVTGPVQVKVYVPIGVRKRLIYVDEGFNGYGEKVKFTETDALALRPDGSFDVMIKASVPVDKKVARSLGLKYKAVPFRLTVTTNGELVTYANGVMEVINGQTFMVQQNNDATKITFEVDPSR